MMLKRHEDWAWWARYGRFILVPYAVFGFDVVWCLLGLVPFKHFAGYLLFSWALYLAFEVLWWEYKALLRAFKRLVVAIKALRS